MEGILFFISGAACTLGLIPLCLKMIRRENEAVKIGALVMIIVALTGGAGFILINGVYGCTIAGYLYYIFFLILTTLSLIDIYCQTVPDIFLLLLLMLGAVIAFAEAVALPVRLAGFVIISLPLLLLSLLTKSFGGGDIKLFAVCGFILGVTNIVLAFLLAVISAAVFGLAFVGIRRGSIKTKIPFVPFISFGAILASLFGNNIITWYLSLF